MSQFNPITLTLDYPQARVTDPRNSVLVYGGYESDKGTFIGGWDRAKSNSGVFIEPLTSTVILTPTPFSREWDTTTSGVYARLRKSNFTLSSSTKWDETQFKISGDYYLDGTDLTGATGICTTSLVKNQGIYLSWYGYNSGDETSLPELIVGYGSSVNVSSGVVYEFYSGGTVVIKVDGVAVASGSLTSKEAPRSVANQWQSLIILPIRRKELIILSKQGGGLVYTLDNLSDNVEGQTITPAGSWWFKVPGSNRRFTLQASNLKHSSTGTIVSNPSYFGRPPFTGASFESPTIYKDTPGTGSQTLTASVVELDGTTAFVANDVRTGCRVKVVLEGDTNTTPYLYGVMAGYGSAVGSCNGDDATDITDYITSLSFELSEKPSSTRLDLSIRDPETMIDNGIADIRVTSGRPILLKIGDYDLLEGFLDPLSNIGAFNPAIEKVTARVSSAWEALATYRFTDKIPLGGVTWYNALRFVLKEVGIPSSQVNGSNPGITLSYPQSPSQGEWGPVINPNDTALEWVEKLFKDYAGNAFYDLVPTVDNGLEFTYLFPDELSSTPDVTLYTDIEEARLSLVAEGVSTANSYLIAKTRTVLTYVKALIKPECNEVRVTGYDWRNRRPLQAYKIDYEARDITLPPADRPKRWVGYPYVWGRFTTSLTTIGDCKRAVEKIFYRLTRHREVIEFTSWLVIKPNGLPLWRGDVVDLGELGIYRIKSFKADFKLEPDATRDRSPNSLCRPTTYTAERIPEDVEDYTAAPPLTNGVLLRQIREQNQILRGRSGYLVVDRGSEFLQGVPPRLVEEAF